MDFANDIYLKRKEAVEQYLSGKSGRNKIILTPRMAQRLLADYPRIRLVQDHALKMDEMQYEYEIRYGED